MKALAYASLILSLCTAGLHGAEESKDWIENPGSQMVFFAVLEGLYMDGLSNAQVDRIIPPGKEISEHFVQNCPLCMPAIEALRLYRARPYFRFKKPIRFEDNPSGRLQPVFPDHLRTDRATDAVVDERLNSDDRAARIAAIQGLIQKWVRIKLDSMRLTAAEETGWRVRLDGLRESGLQILKQYQGAGMGAYAERKICPACDGSADACKLPRAVVAANRPDETYRLLMPEVFFPVLEQLYRQGVSNDDLAALAPLNEADMAHFTGHFVYACRICHSVYEAVRLYRARPQFLSRKAERDTFGPGFPDAVAAHWKSPDAAERRAAIQQFTRQALEARLSLWRLTPDEATAWSTHLKKEKDQGEKALRGYQENPDSFGPGKPYADWKSCPSCDGAAGCKIAVGGGGMEGFAPARPGVEVRPLKQLKNADEF